MTKGTPQPTDKCGRPECGKTYSAHSPPFASCPGIANLLNDRSFTPIVPSPDSQPTMTIDEAIQAMYQGKSVRNPDSPKTWHWKDNVVQWVEGAQWFHPQTFRNRGPEHGWQVVPSQLRECSREELTKELEEAQRLNKEILEQSLIAIDQRNKASAQADEALEISEKTMQMMDGLKAEVSRLEGLNAQYLEVMRYCLDRIGNQWEVKLKLQEALKLSRASSKEETQTQKGK